MAPMTARVHGLMLQWIAPTQAIACAEMLLPCDAAAQLIALQSLSELSVCRIQQINPTDGRESG